MIRKFVTWTVVAVLFCFTARRWLFLVTALLPGRTKPAFGNNSLPTILLLVPFRNEIDTLPDLLWSLERLNYPAHKLTVVFINDGSTDGSEQFLQNRDISLPHWHLLSLPETVGKANALNAALERFSQGEIVAIYDADERPLTTALFELVQPFADPQVGAVSGQRAVSNSLGSPAAAYTTFEGLVHQWVTMRAKDRLNLAPAILGANCAYRRVALKGANNFKSDVLLEDSDLTVKLARLGWQSCFVPGAVSYHRAPQTIAGYWRQHTRWARGFNEVAREQAGPLLRDRRLSLGVRLELLIFSLGYLDRLALVAGLGLSFLKSRVVLGAVVVSLLTPLLQTVTALGFVRAAPRLWLRLAWLPFFFGLDMAMAVVGAWHTLRRGPQIWEERHLRR